jgi:lipopolysaccharide export system protein LptC
VSLEDVQFRAWRGGDLAASGTADRATYRRDSGAVRASKASVVLPRPDAPDLAVSAPVLTGDLPGRTWKGEGGVVLTRGDAVARTPTARWSEADGMVRGDETVEISGPGYRMAGPAFTADPRSGDVEIRGGVRLVAGGGRP